ncbi:hypothetical protein [Prauserella muralis]|uniref:Uncharacterized protein n=1 Tax=Prauserella muralis TaxID=588067 RepID=A0A2V4ABX7_9PSEU|nr:hypothetical protein [Prauserella muralis]PXY16588.1 hypothetical protein BAY60_35945 [Prauserella muralis]TWE11166.1 hypothetical protein FHX69_7385 [Prauserella muralis]
MIRRDRELLAHLRSINTNLGLVVLDLMNNLDDGTLPQDRLTAIADGLECLAAHIRTNVAAIDTDIEEPAAVPPTAVDNDEVYETARERPAAGPAA